jgi:Ca2+:H+ antiporter
MSGIENSNGFPDEREALIPDSRRNSTQHKRHLHWTSWPAHALHLTWATLARDYVNVLLVFVPLGIIAGALHWDSTVVFTLNFLAIVPLASLLSFATEELAATLGQALGGLMNATFGNAVELIVWLSVKLSGVVG